MITKFLLCILQYLLIMVLLTAIGGVGAFVGIKMRKNKDKKNAASQGAEEE